MFSGCYLTRAITEDFLRSGSQLSVWSTGQQFDMFILEKNEGIYWFFTNSFFILIQDVAPTIIGIKILIAKFMFSKCNADEILAQPEQDIDASLVEQMKQNGLGISINNSIKCRFKTMTPGLET